MSNELTPEQKQELKRLQKALYLRDEDVKDPPKKREVKPNE